ncbi:MAG: 30S ribosomal protein S3 [Candidatus Aenigmarchaeota archaeon]|nr:30S ribosomal protein S3 [Candidatus Aenigmarchaeota archaeon]
MIERKFIQKGIRNAELDMYFHKELERVDYSRCDIQRTPLNTRIIIYAGRPGMVIGRGGSKIQEMTETIAKKFKIEKPQLEVRALENPDTDALVVAKQIAGALEKGMSHKRIVNIYLKRIMGAGALGVEIIIAGKISGERSRTEKFREGYIKKSGFPADSLVSKGQQIAVLKAGALGVNVRIMKEFPDIMKVEKEVSNIRREIEEKKVAEEKEKTAKETKAEEPVKDSQKDKETKEKEKPAAKKDAEKKEEKAKETKVTEKAKADDSKKKPEEKEPKEKKTTEEKDKKEEPKQKRETAKKEDKKADKKE